MQKEKSLKTSAKKNFNFFKKVVDSFILFCYYMFCQLRQAIRHQEMREWLSGGAPPCQGGGRGFDPRLALFHILFPFKKRAVILMTALFICSFFFLHIYNNQYVLPM